MSTSSLRSLKLKLLTGYLLLVMLFGVVLTLLVYERRKVEQTTRRTEELVEQRAETERILLDLLDLAFQGEQSVGWETSDMEAYRSKSDSVGIALDNLRLHLGDSVHHRAGARRHSGDRAGGLFPAPLRGARLYRRCRPLRPRRAAPRISRRVPSVRPRRLLPAISLDLLLCALTPGGLSAKAAPSPPPLLRRPFSAALC